MENMTEMSLDTFCARVFAAAKTAGIAPAEIMASSSESFSVRVRESALEDYKVSDRFHLTLRGRAGGRIGTSSTQALDEESIALLIDGVRESAALQLKYMDLVAALFSDVNPIPVKEALNMMGFAAGPCRMPLVGMSDEGREALRAVMQKHGLI